MNITQTHGSLHVKLMDARVITLSTNIILPKFPVKIFGKCILFLLWFASIIKQLRNNCERMKHVKILWQQSLILYVGQRAF